MYEPQPKKNLIMDILDILKRYTDEDHRLSQKEICSILKNEYSMKADRKAVKRNLMNLIDLGYDIEYSESIRKIKNKDGEKEESYILSDFYLNRDFTDAELRLLIDGLLFSKHIPYSQCRELIEKIKNLSNIYFKSRVKYITTFPDDKTDNKQLFYNIDIIDEAIRKKKKISFKYLEYGTDKKMHIKKRDDGSERVYIITPYQMAAKEGKYYLICNYDKYNDISNYRIDRIADPKILEEPAKPFESLTGSDGMQLDLNKYMTEHLYMYSSENVNVVLEINKPMIGDVIDMFGKTVRFFDETENSVKVAACVNRMAVEQFAKSFAPDVVVTEPKELADKIGRDLARSAEIYRSKGENENGSKVDK